MSPLYFFVQVAPPLVVSNTPLSGIEQIEGVGEHAVGGDRALIEIIGVVEAAPARHSRQGDGVPGRAAVDGVIGLMPSAGAQMMFCGVLAAMVPPM